MATSLLALLDDVTTLLDDVATLTKVATRKTAGVLGDDLALNAQQVAGVRANRELPVVWAVAKGSLLNKAILVPGALAISALAAWAVKPLLMVGGAYLCYEGFEKLAHRFLHSRAEDDAHHAELVHVTSDPTVDPVAAEKTKIRGAVRTDFVLSAEIIVITLGVVAERSFATRLAVLIGIALLMTVGVYGLVGAIVKLDDLGLYLSGRADATVLGRAQRRIGTGILTVAPWLMRGLSVAGTAAMFLVGGGILVHGIPGLHHWTEVVVGGVARTPHVGGALGVVTTLLLDAAIGVAAGALVLGVVSGVRRVLRPGTVTP
jgi:predicted DNA repair protein MutK